MNHTNEVLNSVYKGSQMGFVSTEHLLNIVDDGKMRTHLKTQYMEYKDINNRAKDKLNRRGLEAEKISPIAKISSDISVRMNTIIDKTPSHIAEMMMQGNMMGVIKATKVIKNNTQADTDSLKLAGDLLRTEEENIQSMKQFL